MDKVEKYLVERSPGGSITPGIYTGKLMKIDKKIGKSLDELEKFLKKVEKEHTLKRKNSSWYVNEMRRTIKKQMLEIHSELIDVEINTGHWDDLKKDMGTTRRGF